ncbi:MAG: CgeB family protein [Gemmatimonadaceae bacterium]
MHRSYRARRDRYAKRASVANLRYDESQAAANVAQRLAARGYVVRPRARGEVHTFAFISRVSWHESLLPDLRELGLVTEFDYVALGYSNQEFAAGAAGKRQEMNALLLESIIEANHRQPIDWVFMYATGGEILASTVRAIIDQVGVPVVNMCLDDKHSWETKPIGEQRGGQIDIASAYDLSWTSARVACEWYLVEGGNPVYLPEGFDVTAFHPLDVPRDIAVSFVGAAYGFRPSVIDALRRANIPVRAFGDGWGDGRLTSEEVVSVFNRSQVNLGMGGIGYSQELTNLKGRDFEIPGCGGGVYLTSFNPDLAEHFVIGREILCYRSTDELVELSRWCLQHPDAARNIALRARRRCLEEHRWLHRYVSLCEILGILAPAN